MATIEILKKLIRENKVLKYIEIDGRKYTTGDYTDEYEKLLKQFKDERSKDRNNSNIK
jgi:hypothetical protein